MIISKHLKYPLITEKSMVASSAGKYVFKAGMFVNKYQLKDAVESLFSVDVISIKSMVMPGKKRRLRGSREFIKTPGWKKFIVQLKSGQKIDIGANE